MKSTTSNLCICSVQLLSHHSHIIILYMHHSLSQYCINILNEGRIGIAAQQVGIAKGCLDVALPYLNERKQFGTVIGNFQVRSILIERSAFVAYRLLHLPNQGTSPRLAYPLFILFHLQFLTIRGCNISMRKLRQKYMQRK